MATDARRFRYNLDSWKELGEVAPDGNRSAVLSQLADWYLGKSWAALPPRPCDGKPPKLSPRAQAKEDAVKQFRDWYDRKPGVDLPDRPPKT